MTLEDAQKKLKIILDQINANLTNEQRDTLIEDLNALLNEVPASSKTLEVRNTINDTISDLAGANIDVLVGNVEKRSSALSAAVGGLNEVTEHANRVAKSLTLENANMIVGIAKEGFAKVDNLKKALAENNPQKINESILAVSDYLNSILAEAEAKIAELKNG